MDNKELESYLDQLITRHGELERKIEEGYSHYIADNHLNKMKQERLMVKRQIVELQEKLNLL